MNLVRRLTTIAGAIAWPAICVLIGSVVAVICFGGTRIRWTGNLFGSREWWEHGWPLVFLRRTANHESSRFQFTDQDYELEWMPLTLDCLVFLAIIGLLVVGPYLFSARQRTERRRLVFSLSRLFALITCSCLLLGHIGQSLTIARHEQSVAAKLREAGHACELTYIGPTWLARLNGDVMDERLQAFKGIQSIHLRLNQEPNLSQLSQDVRTLRYLDKLVCAADRETDSSLTDASLQSLLTRRQRTRLESISLFHTKVAGSAFANTEEWPCLAYVDIRNSPLDDAGFENLANISTIDWLNVSDTLITRRSLAKAAQIPTLRVFMSKGCGFTEDDLAGLRAAMSLAGLIDLGLPNDVDLPIKITPGRRDQLHLQSA